jgi:3-oxoacyl-[acyl-carrier-protein] synthase III
MIPKRTSATQSSVRISAAGCYLPEHVLDNDSLIGRYGLPIDHDWIFSRTGIRSRHWMRDGQTTSDMCVEAARQVLDRGETRAEEIDRIILATISPDYPSPSSATIVARKLGARCPAFDISAACAGFLYALDLGAATVLSGARKVLVLAADARSRFLDPKDVRSIVLFADGAAGVLLVPSDSPGFRAIFIGAEARERMGAYIPAGGAARPATRSTVEAREHFIKVDSRKEIFELFVQFTREACERALGDARMALEDIDLFITHQGNALMVQAVLEDLGIPPEKAVNNIAEHGNTSGATVAIALAEAIDQGRIRSGSRVLLTSVGAGYTFGAAIHVF